MRNIVSLEWLYEHLQDPDLLIADCRFALGEPWSGRQDYSIDHIPGAFYVDLEEDMSGEKREHGGRHPLPDLGAFSMRASAIGVDASKTVVAYDDQGGAMAARLWWMLRFLGHERVYVLDRGYSQWKAAGYPVTAEAPQASPATFSPKVQRHMLASMDEVKAKLGEKGTVLIDSREGVRYRGEQEAIDPVAGHIPGARNRFWKDALDAEGSWRSAEEQKERFSGLENAEELIVYCGSGVTACPNVLALEEAGIPGVKLYAGSWSDWVSYADNPVATGEE
ncbi:sulfurtransferase [Paenibacillus chitinolyticus]|uniref:Sulfurtransferase n=1 Tax=Paenibacillus chitinolyticus TaxID=79263 RepID=A0A410X4J8_9BACL|nr:sulfurtransferase [Paenibacillus chitinolyticus]MCY9593403.1 sulfurtransferase [Paenibacillus chitinolyticus]MCY9597081.1 sulfurtransferase [Paenibacillus chitinolyticus]QAV21578.1 sulfurtransferase [Paenibacillus chitinolyticus]